MAHPTNPHDKFFRMSMQNAPVAKAFFEQYLPEHLKHHLDLDNCRLEDSSYIDDTLQETFSDLVFSCDLSNDKAHSSSKLVLLVEHQSTPDKFMAFRVYHYMFNMLYKHLKAISKHQNTTKLPAVYAMIFYHGQQTPYPYSLKLQDCFDDPLAIMKHLFDSPVPLIDINQVTDSELKKQQLLGIITGSLKHIRDQDVSGWILWMLQGENSLDINDIVAIELLRTALNYLLNVGNIEDINQFVQKSKELPDNVRGEIMTAAEKLKSIGWEEGLKEGREEGIIKGQEKTAVNLLKEGADIQFVARITDLDVAVVQKLKTELDNS